MLVNFNYDANNSDDTFESGNVDGQTTMILGTSFYSHIDISDNTTGLIAMGFGYTSYANAMNVKDAAITNIALPTWTFAVESGMTDWATCRMGVNAGYILSNTSKSGVGAKDVTSRGGMDTDFSVGLGFNYGSFNLDVDVSEGLFTNPAQYVTGFAPLTDDVNARATLTYAW